MIKKLSKSCQNVVKKLSKKFQKVVKKVQKAQLEKLPHSYLLLSIVINRDFWLRFLLHKKALKSFLHSLTICDEVASGNKKKAQLEKLPHSYQLLSIVTFDKVASGNKKKTRTKSSVSKIATFFSIVINCYQS
jgi:archaellum component FlaD/FlaE